MFRHRNGDGHSARLKTLSRILRFVFDPEILHFGEAPNVPARSKGILSSPSEQRAGPTARAIIRDNARAIFLARVDSSSGSERAACLSEVINSEERVTARRAQVLQRRPVVTQPAGGAA